MPVLPSVQSFAFDLSFFSAHTPDGSASFANWTAALARVQFLDSVDAPFFTVPRATLDAAVAATPTHDNGSWYWNYAVTLDGHAYAGHLRGFASGPSDSWSLVVNAPTLSPPFNNYVWWEGISGGAGLVGVWVIYQPPFTGPAETVRLDWAIAATSRALVLSRVGSRMDFQMGATVWSIAYTSNAPGESFHLSWNPTTGAGGVGESSVTQCWDAQQHDITC